jgi:hypothetical protein
MRRKWGGRSDGMKRRRTWTKVRISMFIYMLAFPPQNWSDHPTWWWIDCFSIHPIFSASNRSDSVFQAPRMDLEWWIGIWEESQSDWLPSITCWESSVKRLPVPACCDADFFKRRGVQALLFPILFLIHKLVFHPQFFVSIGLLPFYFWKWIMDCIFSYFLNFHKYYLHW